MCVLPWPSSISTFSVPLERGLAYCPAMRPIRTTGRRIPQIMISENWRMSPSLWRIFCCRSVSVVSIWYGMTRLVACFKALCTVSGVQQERLVVLDERKLMTQSLNLLGSILIKLSTHDLPR